MPYRVELLQTAARDYARLPPDVRARVRSAIDRLAAEPRGAGVRKLAGSSDYYRVRVGDHRVLYEIRDESLVVLVIRVGHRRDVYR